MSAAVAPSAPATRARRRLHGERRVVDAANFRGRTYWLGTVGWILYFGSPIVPGWLIGAIFDEYQSNGASVRSAVLIALLAAAELAIIWGIAVAHRTYMRGIESSEALIRANVLDAQLASGGAHAGRRDVPVGDVLVRLRDDPFDMMMLLDNWVDLAGALLYGSVATYFLVRIDPWAAFAGIAPLLALGLANKLISNRARAYRARAPRGVERGERVPLGGLRGIVDRQGHRLAPSRPGAVAPSERSPRAGVGHRPGLERDALDDQRHAGRRVRRRRHRGRRPWILERRRGDAVRVVPGRHDLASDAPRRPGCRAQALRRRVGPPGSAHGDPRRTPRRRGRSSRGASAAPRARRSEAIPPTTRTADTTGTPRRGRAHGR